MSEMVELSTLKEILCEGCNENCEEIFCDYQSLFKRIPTIDAVPVVLCKNCEKSESEFCQDCIVWCNEHQRMMKEDDFCSYGERRDTK